jgi:hypothetical protein
MGLLTTLNLACSLPVGIRIDRDGIQSAAGAPGSPSPERPLAATQVIHRRGQSRAVFSRPWEGSALYLITGTPGCRDSRKLSFQRRLVVIYGA